MNKKYAILPCNGLDKCAGCITKETALKLSETTDSEIICPVLYRVSDARYKKLVADNPLLVIDGCATRCASKLATEKGLKIAEKVLVADEAKAQNIQLSGGLRLGEKELGLAQAIVDRLIKEKTAAEKEYAFTYPHDFDYEIYAKDKFAFRLPKDNAFFFNENDCWAYVQGNTARIGVTDYAQKSLSDIIFFTPPEMGSEIDQFGEAGEIESGKAVFEIVSPVSGKVIAVNEKLTDTPELINENPYTLGWVADIQLRDFASDKDLLYNFDQYFEVLKRKVDEFHV
jgi:glycine cleavage system H protein